MSSPSPRAADVLGRVTLVTGKEEFLNERTVVAVRDSVRQYDPESEFSETVGSDLTLATLGEMAAPSLFSSIRCVVVRGLENLPEESVEGLLAYAAAPADEVALVLVHGGGQKGSGTLTKLRKLATVTESKSGELRASEYPSFVAAEIRGHGATIDPDAADFLVQAVGQDLRSLSAAADQLTSDFIGQPITAEKVKQYFGGRAEAKSFAVADAAFWGRRTEALEELRWALDGGTAGGAGHLRVRGRRPRGRPLPVRAAGDARGRPGPRGRRAAVEAAHHPRPVPRAGPTAGSPGRSRRSPAPTPTSRARRATRRTPSSGWCSPSPRCATRADLARKWRRPARQTDERVDKRPTCHLRPGGGVDQSDAAFLAIADLRFAAWFLWMTPLEAALSSLRAAS